MKTGKTLIIIGAIIIILSVTHIIPGTYGGLPTVIALILIFIGIVRTLSIWNETHKYDSDKY